MDPHELRRVRLDVLGLIQEELAARLGLSRVTIARYEGGARRIPPMLALALRQLAGAPQLPMAGVIAAGKPIEAIPQHELVEVPSSMATGTDGRFALRVKGESMRDDGIVSGDLIIVHRQPDAANGQTVVAMLNGEATVKRLRRASGVIELLPANPAMQPIVVSAGDDFRIEGVVVGVIRQYR